MQGVSRIDDSHKQMMSEGFRQKLSAALLVLAGLTCCALLIILSRGM